MPLAEVIERMVARIGDLLSQNCIRMPDAAALIDGDRTTTWRELQDRANRLASSLQAMGHGRHSRVATIVPNDTTAIELLYGLAIGGVVGIPVNYGLTLPEVEQLLADSAPQAIIVDGQFVERLQTVLDAAKATVIVKGGAPLPGWIAYEDLLSRGSVDFISPAEPDDIRTIRYTSGTTATPKGCLGTHRQILASIANFHKEIPLPEDRPFLQMLPLFSGAGIWMAFTAAYHGVANVLLPFFDAARALTLIEQHGVGHACGVPTMMRRLCDAFEAGSYRIPSFKLFGYTGAPMPPALIRRAMKLLPCDFYQGFGGGEMGGLVSYLLPDDHRKALSDPARERRLASGGRPAGYATVTIRDLGTDAVLKANEIGEIAVRSASNFSGYHNRPEDTAKTLRGDRVYTGDVGYLDDDGYLYIIDRAKDMVVSGGMNVSSAEVEAVLVEHPAVQAAAVIGLPDEEWGEVVTGVVTLRPAASVKEAELIAWARQKLAGYKAPKSIRFLDELPLNSAGKVLKRNLRDSFIASSAAH